MRNTMPLYIIIILLLLILIALFVGSAGLKGPVNISDDLRKQMDEFDAVAALVINKSGNVRFASANKSNQPEKCTVGESENRCKGFGRDGTVEEILSITLLRTTGSNCFVSINALGEKEQLCW